MKRKFEQWLFNYDLLRQFRNSRLRCLVKATRMVFLGQKVLLTRGW
jgi:hypothetical protein